jgi:DNA polymerase III alpha subunit
MAGYSLGGADLLRRAKKLQEAMDVEAKFLAGSAKWRQQKEGTKSGTLP